MRCRTPVNAINRLTLWDRILSAISVLTFFSLRVRKRVCPSQVLIAPDRCPRMALAGASLSWIQIGVLPSPSSRFGQAAREPSASSCHLPTLRPGAIESRLTLNRLRRFRMTDLSLTDDLTRKTAHRGAALSRHHRHWAKRCTVSRDANLEPGHCRTDRGNNSTDDKSTRCAGSKTHVERNRDFRNDCQFDWHRDDDLAILGNALLRR